ncbi:Glutamine-binding periplasmic protein [Starkeya nomas]|uniref:Glutamine-binding periplasmic protein n=2 Tax=Xanthobacteraceae TaxID=335928 RepID=A0A5S9PJX0_9HYPH|nr:MULTISPECIES: ABC transporter substrate-binding protein [Xanthobacteraceae]CAA0104580.1 Glutamine-binding periplasmic protein [Starkeya nomas]
MVVASRVIMRILTAALALAFGAPAAVPPARADSELRVGTYLDNKPWQFRDGTGAVVGFEVDLVEAIGAQIGRKVVIHEMVFGEMFPALEEGRIDLAMSTISIVAPRVGRFDFTQPYYETTQGVVVMRNSPIRSLGDLAGRTVSVIPQTTSDLWVTANKERLGIAAIRKAEGLDEGLAWLGEGSVDAHVGDIPALLYRLLGRSDLAVVARVPSDERYALMLARNSPLTEPIDAAITKMKRDGTLARIHQKWFGIPPEPDGPTAMVLPRP